MPRYSRRLPLIAALPALMLAGCEVKDAPGDNPSGGNDTVTVTQNVRSPDNMSEIGGTDVNAIGPANSADDMLMNSHLPAPVAGNQKTSQAPDTDARQTVQRYYAHISAGQYDRARAMWDDDGKASGKDAATFANQFDKYSSYQADIGEPQNADAGAGNRYIEVPVMLHGTLRGGASAFRTKAKVVLHRTADIDGASEQQKRWHIARIEMPQGATGG